MTLVLATTLILTATITAARAHAPAAKTRGLEARIAFQEQQVKHHRYVCHQGANYSRWWHCRALAWTRRELAESWADRYRLQLRDPKRAICAVFGPYCHQALRVSSCETGGTFSVWATNGQYLGLFQMGNYARSTFGHGATPLAQARAAYRYFVASGRDWSPWTCQP